PTYGYAWRRCRISASLSGERPCDGVAWPNEESPQENDMTGKALIGGVVIGTMLFLFSRFMSPDPDATPARYSDFPSDVESGRVDFVVLQGETIEGLRKDNTRFRTYNPETDATALIGALRKADVGIEGRAPEQPHFLTQLLLQLAPALLLILVFVYMLRQMQGAAGGRGAMSFGKSKARLLGEDQVNGTFADVAGVD